MKSERKETVEVTLILTEAEARWLKLLCQNNVCGHTESKEENSIRLEFWSHLTSQGVK